jgi:hypothetical protein
MHHLSEACIMGFSISITKGLGFIGIHTSTIKEHRTSWNHWNGYILCPTHHPGNLFHFIWDYHIVLSPILYFEHRVWSQNQAMKKAHSSCFWLYELPSFVMSIHHIQNWTEECIVHNVHSPILLWDWGLDSSRQIRRDVNIKSPTMHSIIRLIHISLLRLCIHICILT